ncbi:sensor histidine kinase [Polaromonas jejuensis]|uniref:histidine kinase n=1 Tax=Polaromonas jejuensis TaxID=457502 RepID=A0ABW0QAS0_9BURK|nr:histidine kinase [Polaromonas jejuensis]
MTELDLIVCAIKNIQTHAELASGRFAALTDSLNVAALICDKEGKITVLNRQGLRMLHANEAEFPHLTLADVLVHMGLNLVDRMRLQPRALGRRPIDGFLIDTGGVKHRVSMLVHPLDVADSGAGHAMIILAPENKRAALYQALTRSGSAYDYLSNFLLLAQERERKRIASDLHDGLGQVLTMLKFRVEDALIRLDADKVDESKGILKEVVGQLRGAVGEVRRISTELRPSMLDDLGLLPTLQWLCRQFEAAHTGISVTLEEKIAEENIPIPVKTPMFRMIQEAMNNVAKHARATSVFIYLQDHHDGFVVGVVDNGIGFDAERLTSGTACLLGVGINSMRERVEASRGVFRIRSHAGFGTAISAAWGSSHDDFQLTDSDFLESYSRFHKETRPLDLNLTH